VCDIEDPTKHAIIYELIKDQLLPMLQSLNDTIHINVSPGTPAMHAVWLVLHAGGQFPPGTRLWSSQQSRETKRTRIDPVDFQINTYLREIRSIAREDPERA